MALALNDLSLQDRFAALDDDKARFVSKVYSGLSISLLLSAAVCGIGISIFKDMSLAQLHGISRMIWFAQLAVVLGALFIRMQGALAWAYLAVFVSVTGLALAPILIMYEKFAGIGTIAAALALTGTIFLTLTAYVRYSGKDFSYLGGFLWMATIGLCVAGLVFMFFPGLRQQVNFLYSAIGALIFCGWILFDTSAVTRQYYRENNIAGAVLNLYVDILQLFLFILSMLSDRRRD
jgi:FtsH-binding integral membrane protein